MEFLNVELIAYIASLAPGLAAIISMIIVAIKSLHKVKTEVESFTQSKEVKELIAYNKKLSKDNALLAKNIEQLTIELSKVKPKGWTDDSTSKE